MKKDRSVSAFSLGLTYAGCFFGAGYVSGQELWQFFGAFGTVGYLGVLLSILLFFVFGVMLVRSAQLSGKIAFDEVIIISNNNILRSFLAFITVFLMFGVIVIMTAGAGSLLYSVFDIPNAIGCAIFSILVCIIALFGISGVIKVFSYVIPVLVLSTLVICILAINRYGVNLNINSTDVNPLLGSWWFSALNYVSYNIISLVGTIIPVGMYVKKRRTVYSGVLFGCVIALSLAAGIILAVTSMISSVQSELPMLDVAFSLHTTIGYIYALLLLCAMFGTSLACFAATTAFTAEKLYKINPSEKIINFVIGIFSYICSLAGFGTLVGTVYPIFGYLGFVVLFFIAHSFIKLKLKDGIGK